MADLTYIDPIMDRTMDDVEYARTHQTDLTNKNKGAWNYTDLNRIANNLKYAAQWMYEQGFLSKPYTMEIKTNWVETDIITLEDLNNMIVNNMNNLHTFSRDDLEWYPITILANIDYNTANWLERNIHNLATQVPPPPEKYKLTVNSGSGSGEYEARTVVTIKADPPKEGFIFDHWAGDHLENIASGTSEETTYTMPNQDITLQAIYTNAIPHTFTFTKYDYDNSKYVTTTQELSMGEIVYIEADPAPQGKVFYEWEVEPSTYEKNLYEQAATTHFTMPNEAVSVKAVYITKGEKYLEVRNGTGTGWYEYGRSVAVSSNKSSGQIFTGWSGDTQYLTADKSQEYNSVKIPDVQRISITANYYTPYVPATGLKLTVVNGVITDTGETEGTYDEGNQVNLTYNTPPEGKVFAGWSHSGGGSMSGNRITIGRSDATVTATYRTLEYYTLTVTTHSGTTVKTVEKYSYFSINANPAPDGYTFDKWTGDISGLSITSASTGAIMGSSGRTITAVYRPINPHTLTVNQRSGTSDSYTQAEFTTVQVTAEDAPAGMRFTGWSLSGKGSLSSYYSKTTTFTFGNGDATLTPRYVNVWTVTVSNGTINGSASAVLDEGSTYDLYCRSLKIYEKFEGWAQNGPGTINNTASTSTRFTVGHGDTNITANISQYPDKTLTVYWRHPDTNVTSLLSQQTYQYGSRIVLEAPIAPNQSTFLAWEGDVDIISTSQSALASSIIIDHLTKDAVLTATYFYPDDPKYYTLTVYNGYPESRNCKEGEQAEVRANEPSQGYEFYKWYGDTKYLVNPDRTVTPNSIIMPAKAITLKAKYNLIGELPLFRVGVSGGTAKATYYTTSTKIDPETKEEKEEQVKHDVEGATIDVPPGTEVTLTADLDEVGFGFDFWDGNFEEAGITDIEKSQNPAKFTMAEDDVSIIMNRRPLKQYTLTTVNASGAGDKFEGTYEIHGTLTDTDDKKYEFLYWTCVDADGNDCISAIKDPDLEQTEITILDRSLWVEAHYKTYYKLTVINGQDTGRGYYYEGEEINSVYANDPEPGSNTEFDQWNDPYELLKDEAAKYDKTPTLIMKNSPASITATYIANSPQENSMVVTGNDLHTGIITRSKSTIISGRLTVGAVVFDKDGCIGVVIENDPDQNDNTDDYKVKKLFYGGNF